MRARRPLFFEASFALKRAERLRLVFRGPFPIIKNMGNLYATASARERGSQRAADHSEDALHSQFDPVAARRWTAPMRSSPRSLPWDDGRMKSSLWALGFSVAVVAGCDDATSGSGGEGSTSSNKSTTASVMPNCTALPCTDTDMDDTNDCVSCSQRAGKCTGQLSACGGNKECVAFFDCSKACPVDDPKTQDDENLACLCTVDPGSGGCKKPSDAGTCAGDHPNGTDAYFALVTCVLGDLETGMGGECSGVCAPP
jgi:hypothetical protein